MSKGKSTLTAVAVGTVLASAARVFAISKTDMTSGLLVHGNEVLCSALYFGTVVLTAVICALIWIKDRNTDVSGLEGRSAVIIGFGMLAAAFCAGIEGVAELSAFTPSKFLIFIDFMFAAVLGIIAFVTLYLKEFKPWLGFIYSFGGIFCVTRGINLFMDRMVVTAIPEYLINGLLTVGGAMAFLALARLLSGNAGKFTKAALFGWGMGTGVMALSAYIGGVIAKFMLPSEVSDRIVFSSNSAEFYYQAFMGIDAYQMAFPSVADAAVGVFIILAILAVSLSKKADS